MDEEVLDITEDCDWIKETGSESTPDSELVFDVEEEPDETNRTPTEG
jgi:hypothetical protein